MRKVIYGIYTAWDYDLELQKINDMSDQGWQLVKGATFYQVYERSDIKYRYHLEFAPQGWKREDDVSRFFELYREQGWELINSTFNGWYYFRKEVIEGADESEYMVFTDDTSLREMTRRWIILARVVQVVFCIYAIMMTLSYIDMNFLHDLILAISYLAFAGFLQAGVVSMKRKHIGDKKKKVNGISRLLGIFVILFMIVVSVIAMKSPILMTRCSLDAKWAVEEGVAKNFEDFTIKSDGKYELYVRMECKDSESMAMVEIVDENNNVIIRSGGNEFTLSKKINLDKGEYSIQVIMDAENNISDTVHLEVRIGR